MTDTTTAPLKEEDLNKRTDQFIKLRDLKAVIEERHELELKPINEAMEGLKGIMATAMDALKVDSVKTPSGTVSFSTKVTATIADMNAFWNHCVVNADFAMIDKKANKTAIKDYVDKHGAAPPGVNYSTFRDIGVRRKS
jgi:hypothetical protein